MEAKRPASSPRIHSCSEQSWPLTQAFRFQIQPALATAPAGVTPATSCISPGEMQRQTLSLGLRRRWQFSGGTGCQWQFSGGTFSAYLDELGSLLFYDLDAEWPGLLSRASHGHLDEVHGGEAKDFSPLCEFSFTQGQGGVTETPEHVTGCSPSTAHPAATLRPPSPGTRHCASHLRSRGACSLRHRIYTPIPRPPNTRN